MLYILLRISVREGEVKKAFDRNGQLFFKWWYPVWIYAGHWIFHEFCRMTITHTEIYRYTIPMVPFTIATGTMKNAQNLFIRIHTSEGITGVGECSAFPMIAGETQATCYEMAKDFAALWKDKAADDIGGRLHELDLFTAGNYTAKSAFDLALYDIAAKAAGQPLYRYLGGERKPIESDLTIG